MNFYDYVEMCVGIVIFFRYANSFHHPLCGNCIVAMLCMKTVSYTHLDVYKRQDLEHAETVLPVEHRGGHFTFTKVTSPLGSIPRG